MPCGLVRRVTLTLTFTSGGLAAQEPSRSAPLSYPLLSAWYAETQVRYYDFGPASGVPASLYRLADGTVVFSSVPAMPQYNPVRQLYDVKLDSVNTLHPPRSAERILALVSTGKARMTARPGLVNVPIVPAGSTLEADPDHRLLLDGWFHDQPVNYFDFGAARATPMRAAAFSDDGAPSTPVVSAVPGAAEYGDLWAVDTAVSLEQAKGTYRDYRVLIASARRGTVRITDRRVVRNRPVIYVAENPVHRSSSADRRQQATAVSSIPSGLPAVTPRPVTAKETTSETSTTVASGLLNQTAIRPPRVDGRSAEIVIDGVLDEPVWKTAALLTGFSEYQPADGRPAEDSTQVLVWYGPTAIYFGIRAFEPHGTVHATLATRDHLQNEDNVQILLDTFNGHRQAAVFGVNAFGVQADGTLTEGLQQRNAGISGSQVAQSARDTVDLSADFVFESKGRLTDYGFEVEIRIPFKTLRFQPLAVQNWGINIIRDVQHSGHEDSWTPAQRAASTFLGQSGTLMGLHDLSRGLVLDLNPEATSKVNGVPPTTAGPWTYAWANPRFGGNVRWGITNNLTLNGTVNPDFSQIEADIQQVIYDPRSSPFYPEKRPFFLDGIELFQVPNNLIYTRRLISPVGAVKLSGSMSGTNVALLSGADDKSYSASGTQNPIYNMLRVRRDLGPGSAIGAVYTDRVEGSTFNRVAAIDTRLLFSGIYDWSIQAGGSLTGGGGSSVFGPMWWSSFNRNGRSFALHYTQTGLSPNFITQSGFISRGSVVNTNLAHVFTFYGKPGSLLESWSYNLTLNGVWSYHHFVGGKIPDEPKFHNTVNFTFKRGWRAGGFVYLESFNYDSLLFGHYYLQRHRANGVVDTIPYGTGAGRIRNIDLGINFATPQFSHFGLSASLLGGPDDNFFEWSQALIWLWSGSAYWYPTERLRFTAQYNEQRYLRWDDRTLVGVHRIPYLKVEYQLSRPLFLRLVGQYDARWQDSLRDDSRTNFPILIYNAATGTFSRASSTTSNQFTVNWLLSYQPIPGTVFFAGYGSNLTEPDAFRFKDLSRTGDGFFVKVTYLFRL